MVCTESCPVQLKILPLMHLRRGSYQTGNISCLKHWQEMQRFPIPERDSTQKWAQVVCFDVVIRWLVNFFNKNVMCFLCSGSHHGIGYPGGAVLCMGALVMFIQTKVLNPTPLFYTKLLFMAMFVIVFLHISFSVSESLLKSAGGFVGCFGWPVCYINLRPCLSVYPYRCEALYMFSDQSDSV